MDDIQSHGDEPTSRLSPRPTRPTPSRRGGGRDPPRPPDRRHADRARQEILEGTGDAFGGTSAGSSGTRPAARHDDEIVADTERAESLGSTGSTCWRTDTTATSRALVRAWSARATCRSSASAQRQRRADRALDACGGVGVHYRHGRFGREARWRAARRRARGGAGRRAASAPRRPELRALKEARWVGGCASWKPVRDGRPASAVGLLTVGYGGKQPQPARAPTLAGPNRAPRCATRNLAAETGQPRLPTSGSRPAGRPETPAARRRGASNRTP